MKKKKKRGAIVRDKHLLYTASVQSVDADLDFFERVYRKRHGRRFRLLREDFCGTAVLAFEWVRRRSSHRAWGVDLDSATLDWGRQHYAPVVGASAERLELICRDVRAPAEAQVDVVAALNFSYSVFKTRPDLRAYFEQARASLRPGGILFVDAFGGTETLCEDREERKIPASKSYDGSKIPAFTYVWEQKRFNPLTHRIVCQIHFKLGDGTRIKKAFRYDWRLWTLVELQELMLEAGFKSTEVYLEGWDDEADDTDGVFRRRKYYDNAGSWVAYVVGLI